MSALPARDETVSGTVVEPHRMVWVVQGSLETIKIWLLQLSSHRLGM